MTDNTKIGLCQEYLICWVFCGAFIFGAILGYWLHTDDTYWRHITVTAPINSTLTDFPARFSLPHASCKDIRVLGESDKALDADCFEHGNDTIIYAITPEFKSNNSFWVVYTKRD